MGHLDPDGSEVHERVRNCQTPTNAELGAELCQCWIDRVALAKMQFDRET
jgi:hypothetical protein